MYSPPLPPGRRRAAVVDERDRKAQHLAIRFQAVHELLRSGGGAGWLGVGGVARPLRVNMAAAWSIFRSRKTYYYEVGSFGRRIAAVKSTAICRVRRVCSRPRGGRSEQRGHDQYVDSVKGTTKGVYRSVPPRLQSRSLTMKPRENPIAHKEAWFKLFPAQKLHRNWRAIRKARRLSRVDPVGEAAAPAPAVGLAGDPTWWITESADRPPGFARRMAHLRA